MTTVECMIAGLFRIDREPHPEMDALAHLAVVDGNAPDAQPMPLELRPEQRVLMAMIREER